MLKAVALDTQGNEHELLPLTVTLCKEENVPADSVELTVKGVGYPRFCSVELYRDGKLIFSGEIDEQIAFFENSPYTELVARSSAARLIDNEAYPMSFVNPSSEDIFEHYAKPCGFTQLGSENRSYNGRFTVSKGASCFSVLKKFAAEVYGGFPRAEGSTLYLDGLNKSGTIILSNGICQKLRVADLRCNRVSAVYVKLKDSGGYKTKISDSKAEAEGINKVRYLNVSPGSSAAVCDADSILSKARAESFYAEADCIGYFGDALGKTAVHSMIDDTLYVSAVRYTLKKTGEHTRLTLKRKEN